jgi:4'-phosphopantetheinyl transferase
VITPSRRAEAPERVEGGLLAPGPDELVVIRVSLTPSPAEARELEALLTEEERARTGRSPIPEVRQRNTLTRGWVRRLLGLAVGCDPRALTFGTEPGGKPTLEPLEGGAASVGRSGAEAPQAPQQALPSFNLSHTGDHLLLALAREGHVGVDAELRRPLPELEGVAARVFTQDEREALARLVEGEPRLAGFYRGWTRKEALLKALGGGLAIPLRRFTVSLEPGGDALVRAFPDPATLDPARLSPGAGSIAAGAWWVGDLAGAAPPGAEAAVAWDRCPQRIRCIVAPGV